MDLVDNVLAAATFDAVMKARSKDLVDDTVLFWRPSEPAIYIGFHQLAYEDVNVDLCKEKKVPIIRRILGGGTGYSDRDQIIYNIIFKEDNPLIPHGPKEVYGFVLGGLIEALHVLGIADTCIDTERFGVYANGKKISGSGQMTSQGVVNSGGSFLVDFDFEAMSMLLTDPVKNLKKGITRPEDGMTYLRKELGDISVNDAKTALREGFSRVLGGLIDGSLSSFESNLAEELREKYTKKEWIFRSDIRKERRKLRKKK